MSLNVKDHVKDNQRVHFEFFRMGTLYYKTELGLLFEVPINDIGTATMLNEDKALLYMRWIRKQIEANKQGMKDSGIEIKE